MITCRCTIVLGFEYFILKNRKRDLINNYIKIKTGLD